MMLDETFLSFFTSDGVTENQYNNSNVLYNGVNNRITDNNGMQLKFDNKLILPTCGGNSSELKNYIINNMPIYDKMKNI